MYIGVLEHGRPAACASAVQNRCYDFLEENGIPFDLVQHDPAETLEKCAAVDAALGAKICKNLFLCTRNKSAYYLLLMPGDKIFKTKGVTGQLGCSRLSFAGGEEMQEKIGCAPGSASVLGLLFDTGHKVQLVLDRDLLENAFIGCHPCENTASLRLRTADVLKIANLLGHAPVLVRLGRCATDGCGAENAV